MPATPSYCQSQGSPQTVTLRTGKSLALRNGCLVDEKTRETITGSRETAAYVLEHCCLTDDERLWWSTWGSAVCDRMSSQESRGQCGSGLGRKLAFKEQMEASV